MTGPDAGQRRRTLLAGVRVLSGDGAAFALVPVPGYVHGLPADAVAMDVGLLSPRRHVRYLGRVVSVAFLERLAEAWLRCAADAVPEQSVPTVEDERAGIAVLAVGSTTFEVTLQVLVVADLDEPEPERDFLDFVVKRSSLVIAAHAMAAVLDEVRASR